MRPITMYLLLDVKSFASKSNYKRSGYYACNNDELNQKPHTWRHDTKDQRTGSSRMLIPLSINGLSMMDQCFLSLPYFQKA